MIVDGVEQEVTPPQPAKGKEPETVTIPKAEWERSQRETTELRESEKYWSQRARGGKEPEPADADEDVDTTGLVPAVTGNEDVDEAIFENPEKWTDAITKGPKAIEAFMRKAGYINSKEVAEIAIKAARQVVTGTVQGMQSDAQIMADFPDMKNNGADGTTPSELFKLARPIYQKLVAMNGGKQSSALIYSAAAQAKAVLDAKAPKPKPADEDPYDRYDEQERRDRADAQGARRGRSAPVEDDDAGSLGPEAKAICVQMGIKEEDFIKSQKELGTRRRR